MKMQNVFAIAINKSQVANLTELMRSDEDWEWDFTQTGMLHFKNLTLKDAFDITERMHSVRGKAITMSMQNYDGRIFSLVGADGITAPEMLNDLIRNFFRLVSVNTAHTFIQQYKDTHPDIYNRLRLMLMRGS